LEAYVVNDAKLPEKYFPMRLALADPRINQMVEKIDIIMIPVMAALLLTHPSQGMPC
jgi:hypothetical protein